MSNQGSTNQKHGKEAEKRLTGMIGNGAVHTGLFNSIDITHPFIGIEVKSYKSFAFVTFMKQAISNARSKIPMLICHVKGSHYNDSYVIIRYEDAKKKFGMFDVKHDIKRLFD